MAKLSLQEQLLKSGLVSAGQARAVKSEKQKQTKQQHHNKLAISDDVKEQAKKAKLEQANRDRKLNQQRKQEDENKHLAAQVKQLIEQNRLPKVDVTANQLDDGIAYHFTDDNKVKTIFFTKNIREKIVQGQLAIVKLGPQYEVVPAEIAGKIKLRDAPSVIVFNETITIKENKEDPYADFQVPDDMTW